MFKILRFRRGAGWNPEVHGVYDDAEEGYVRQTARGILATTTEGVVVIVGHRASDEPEH